MVYALYGRAGVHPRRTDHFLNLKNNNVRRAKSPALQSGANGRSSRKPRAVEHPWRAAYMPPLQTRQPRTRTQIRGHKANAHGPHACGHYRPAGNNRQMGKADVCRRPARPRTRAGFQNGSPDEPFRQERNGIVTESICLVRNVNRLGRPHQSPGVSKGARRPLGRAPRLGISGGFFASFLAGQKHTASEGS